VSGKKKTEPGTTGLSITPPLRCVTTAVDAVHGKVRRPYDDDDDDNDDDDDDNNTKAF